MFSVIVWYLRHCRTAHSRSVDEVHKKWEKYVLYGRAVCAIKVVGLILIKRVRHEFLKHARKTQQGSVIHDPFLVFFLNLFLLRY